MKKLLSILILSVLCVCCAIGLTACENEKPYYGTYSALNEDDKIIIDDNGFNFGGKYYNFEDNNTYFTLTNYSGNTTKWYRYENDNVISPKVTFNFDTGSIPTRNGFFDATLTALDGRLNATSVFYFTSYGEYQLIFPNAPALSEKGTYWLEDGLLKLNGRFQLSNKQTTTQYYIDENFNIHVYAYVKDLSLFKRTMDDATYTPTTTNEPTPPTETTTPTEPSEPNEPTTPAEQNEPTTPTEPSEPTTPNEPSEPTTPIEPEEPVETYELKYKFSSALEGYVVSGYEGTITDSVVIPSTYKNIPIIGIGNSAFYNCRDLKSITIPDSVTSIGNYAFYGCNSLANIKIGNSVTSIGTYAFSYCSGLTSVTIPDSVTSIGEDAFYGCSSLTSIIFGKNSQLQIIESYAFFSCNSLISISIPDNVMNIGSDAFDFCSSLTRITIPERVQKLGYDKAMGHYNGAIFLGCVNLKTIYLDSAYAVNYADFADTLPEYATDIYILTSIEPTLSVYTIVYEKQDGTVINDGKEYYHYKIKE